MKYANVGMTVEIIMPIKDEKHIPTDLEVEKALAEAVKNNRWFGVYNSRILYIRND